ITILMRYVLNINFYASEEILLIPVIWLYFIGASFGTHTETHIAADFIDNLVKNKSTKLIFKIIKHFITLFVMFFYTKWVLDLLIWSFHNAGTTTGWSIPVYIYYIPIIISFILIVLYTFIYCIREFSSLLKIHFK